MSKTTLQKMAPAWHAEAVEILKTNFTKIHSSFCDATKKAVWFGMFLNYIKFRGDRKTGDGSIAHGEFGPWLEKNFPDLPWRTANTYMRLGREAGEKGKIEIRQFSEFAHSGELPPPIEKLIEGKTQQQLFLEFKQVDENDPERAKRGRRKGEGGRLPDAHGTIEEIAAARKKASWRHCCKAADELEKVGVDFIALDDGQILKLQSVFERTAKCMTAWLNTPATRRDGKEIQKLWRTL